MNETNVAETVKPGAQWKDRALAAEAVSRGHRARAEAAEASVSALLRAVDVHVTAALLEIDRLDTGRGDDSDLTQQQAAALHVVAELRWIMRKAAQVRVPTAA